MTVLTCRVLLALAQGGTWQAGPVHFGAEFSPVASMPIAPARAAALAGLALSLLDGVLAQEPALFDAAHERIAALALLGRHDEAVAACDAFLATAPGHRAQLELQRARVHLAAGRSQRAHADVAAVLAREDRRIAGWRVLAQITEHLGDLPGELAALERTVALLRELPRDPSVFPDSAALLPELQLRRANVLVALGRVSEADALLAGDSRDGALGGALAGAYGARVQWQRLTFNKRTRGVSSSAPKPVDALPADSPLQWLRGAGQDGANVAAALQRGWVDPAALPSVPVTEGALANLRLARGEVGIAAAAAKLRDPDATATPAALWARARAGEDLDSASGALPTGALLPHVQEIVSQPGGAARLLGLADSQLRVDPANSEARLLRGAVLFVAGQQADASAFLAKTLGEHPGDLRARYLLAAAALSQNDRSTLQRALRRESGLLDAATLEGARAALRTVVAVSGQQLVDALE